MIKKKKVVVKNKKESKLGTKSKAKFEYGFLLKKHREYLGLSQAYVAEQLGMSRTSYIAVEQGTRELTISEAERVADVFGVDFSDLIDNKGFKREKYKQMLFFFLRLFKNGVQKTKLAKLLYLSDFAYFYENLQSMSGLKYRKIDYGPVPDDYFYLIEELSGAGEIKIKETGKAHLISKARLGNKISDSLLSADEKVLMRKIYRRWKEARTDDIVKFTHKQIPYEFADYKGIIPYELILQEDHENIY